MRVSPSEPAVRSRLHLPELVLPDASQRPCHQAVLEFDVKLAESGNRQSETVRCQRFEQQSFDCGVDAQGGHLLAARPAMLMLVGATNIDRIAARANSNTLQQCEANRHGVPRRGNA